MGCCEGESGEVGTAKDGKDSCKKECWCGGSGGSGGSGNHADDGTDFDSLPLDKQVARVAQVADSCAREAATHVDRAEAAVKAMADGVPDYSAAAALAQASTDMAIRACRAYAADAAEAARDARHSADMAADAAAVHDDSVLSRIHAGAISRAGDNPAIAANIGAQMMCSAATAAAAAKRDAMPDRDAAAAADGDAAGSGDCIH